MVGTSFSGSTLYFKASSLIEENRFALYFNEPYDKR
jgi:hypothetical protein